MKLCLYGHDTEITGRYRGGPCIACAKNRTPAQRAKKKDLKLKRLFGISLADYNEMFTSQNGLCAGCYRHQSTLKNSLAVDHDHITGEIRGLLCFRCNSTLGMVHDSTAVLEGLIRYLNVRPDFKS